MYYIGIDVHSKKCMTTIKGRTKDILKQTEFDNDVQGINGFIRMIRQEGYMPATAVCESTRNYWIVPHDMLEEAGINTLLAHPHNTKIITQTVYKKRQGRLGEAGRPVQAGHGPGVVRDEQGTAGSARADPHPP